MGGFNYESLPTKQGGIAMEKELKFIFDEKQFNDRQAELLKKIVTALAKGSDVINMSDFTA